MTGTQPNPSRKTILAGVFLLIALLTGWLFFLYPFRNYHFPKDTIYYLSRLLLWLCLCIMFFYAVKVEKRPYLLWKEEKYPFSFYILSFFAIIGILFFGSFFLGIIVKLLKWEGDTSKYLKMVKIFKADTLLLVVTCITAGVVEELLFRGYLMPRLQLLLKKPWLSIFISSALFGAMHFGYGNFAQIAGPFFIGLVFAGYYHKYRNIKVLIFCHFFWDLSLLLIAVKLKH